MHFKVRGFRLYVHLMCVFVSLIIINFLVGAASGSDTAVEKKLIEWGWDEPDSRFIHDNIAKMKEAPFDGFVFHVISRNNERLAWEIWGKKRFSFDDFSLAVSEIQHIDYGRLTERFLRVNVSPGNVDWFDDDGWEAIVANFRVASDIALRTGARGFMFDVESYREHSAFPVFSFRHQNRAFMEFSDYSAKVRDRGNQLIKAISGVYPGISIIFSYGYELASSDSLQWPNENYGLLPSFLDGIREGSAVEVKLVDGWEKSYKYKTQSEFTNAEREMKAIQLNSSAKDLANRKALSLGFGVWLDADWQKYGWDEHDYIANYFTPQTLVVSLKSALEVSDEYVWLYSEKARWWSGNNIPKEYIGAIFSLRKERVSH